MDLVEQIRQLADRFPAGQPLSVHQLASGSAFIARCVQSFAEVRPQRPLLALVLDGKKTVAQDGRRTVLRAGDVLIAPSDVPYQCTVTPDPKSDQFCAFVTELNAEVSTAFARENPAHSPELGAFATDRISVVRRDELVLQSFCHVARTLLTPQVSPPLLTHRLADLLLSLSLQHSPNKATAPDLVLAIRALLRRDLSRAWPAEEVAKKLAMSPSTLRRQLADIGLSLRQLRAEERMSVAAVLLRRREARIADVAKKCGYESPSKFAKQFRRRFGHAPSETGAKSSR
jgi:AraC-like DNA-binding protein